MEQDGTPIADRSSAADQPTLGRLGGCVHGLHRVTSARQWQDRSAHHH
jgi:hypothetical protein